MIENIQKLIHALREELQQYGEMLALLDRQQEQVIARAADDVFQSINIIQSQAEAIHAARAQREDCRRRVARHSAQAEDTTLGDLMRQMPTDYRPLVKALVDENNALLVRVQQRVRQNHLLLSRSVELMREFLNNFFPAREIRVYNGQGGTPRRILATTHLYDAVG